MAWLGIAYCMAATRHSMALNDIHVVELSAMAWNGKEWSEMA